MTLILVSLEEYFDMLLTMKASVIYIPRLVQSKINIIFFFFYQVVKRLDSHTLYVKKNDKSVVQTPTLHIISLVGTN